MNNILNLKSISFIFSMIIQTILNSELFVIRYNKTYIDMDFKIFKPFLLSSSYTLFLFHLLSLADLLHILPCDVESSACGPPSSYDTPKVQLSSAWFSLQYNYYNE